MEAAGLKMTHDELLDKLSTIDFDKMGAFAFYKCLKAVAELHNCSNKFCTNCGMKSPCFTIEAITKELQ